MNYCYCRILIGLAENQRTLGRAQLSPQARADAETGLRNIRQLLAVMSSRGPMMTREERNDAGFAYEQGGGAAEYHRRELERSCA